MKKFESLAALGVFIAAILIGLDLTLAPANKGQGSSSYESHFLAVGQGDAALITHGSDQVLIDGGPDDSLLGELGRLLPITDRRIEAVILSHPHADHLRGLIYLIERYEVAQLYINGYQNNTPEYSSFLALAKQKRIPVSVLCDGGMVNYEGIRLQALWPACGMVVAKDLNDSSIVLDATVNGRKLLFTGDASSGVLDKLKYPVASYDLLKVSHHGSKTGTSKAFIDAINPKEAIIPVGRNSYGHPHRVTLDILAGTKLRRTDLSGTVSYRITTDGVFLY